MGDYLNGQFYGNDRDPKKPFLIITLFVIVIFFITFLTL